MSLYKIMGWTLEQILWLNLIERLLLKLFVEVCLFVEFAKSHRSGANIRLYICSVCAKFQFAKSWFTMKWFAQRIPIENSRSFFNTTLIIYNVRFRFSSQITFFQIMLAKWTFWYRNSNLWFGMGKHHTEPTDFSQMSPDSVWCGL